MTQQWEHKGQTHASRFPAPPKLRLHQENVIAYLQSVIAWAGNVLSMSQEQPKRVNDDKYPELPGEHWEIPGEQWLAEHARNIASALIDMLRSKRSQVLNQFPHRAEQYSGELVGMTFHLARILNDWHIAASAADRKGKRAESAATECIRLALFSGCTDKDGVIDWCREFHCDDDYEIEVDEAGESIMFWPEDGRSPSKIKWENIPRIIRRIRDRKIKAS